MSLNPSQRHLLNLRENSTSPEQTATKYVVDRTDAEKFLHAVAMSLIIVATVVGNILILLAIKRKRTLQNITGAFVANLAVADLLQGIVGMPFVMGSSIADDWIFKKVFCEINGLTNMLFCVTSMMTLGAVSIDRYLSILHPLRYVTCMTTRVAGIMIAYIWLHSFILGIIPVLGWSYYDYLPYEYICTVDWKDSMSFSLFVFSMGFFLPLFVMLYCYFYILRAARRQLKNQRRVQPQGDFDSAVESSSPSKNPEVIAKTGGAIFALAAQMHKKAGRENRTRQKSELKAAFTLLIVIGTFIICWFPHFLGIFCLMTSNCTWPDRYFIVTTIFAMMNSACNPVIYGLMNRRFRTTFKEIILCRKNNDALGGVSWND